MTTGFRLPCKICGSPASWFPKAYLWDNLVEREDYDRCEDSISGSEPLCPDCARNLDFRRAATAAVNAGLVVFTSLGEVIYKTPEQQP